MAGTVLNETLWLLRERGWGGRGSGSPDHFVRDVVVQPPVGQCSLLRMLLTIIETIHFYIRKLQEIMTIKVFSGIA